jgi:hypothetical protein
MDMHSLLDRLVNFAVHYKLLAAVIAIGLLYYAVNKPKEFFKLLVVLAVLGVVLYFVLLFGKTTTTGIGSKDRMIYKTRDAIEKQ